jgi:hypothetical protein
MSLFAFSSRMRYRISFSNISSDCRLPSKMHCRTVCRLAISWSLALSWVHVHSNNLFITNHAGLFAKMESLIKYNFNKKTEEPWFQWSWFSQNCCHNSQISLAFWTCSRNISTDWFLPAKLYAQLNLTAHKILFNKIYKVQKKFNSSKNLVEQK